MADETYGLMPSVLVDEETGAVSFKDRIVGEFDGETLTLNVAWCRLAGLGVKVLGDLDDRRRVLLDRSDRGRTPITQKPVRGTHPVAPEGQGTLPVDPVPTEAEKPPVAPPEPVMSTGVGPGVASQFPEPEAGYVVEDPPEDSWSNPGNY